MSCSFPYSTIPQCNNVSHFLRTVLSACFCITLNFIRLFWAPHNDTVQCKNQIEIHLKNCSTWINLETEDAFDLNCDHPLKSHCHNEGTFGMKMKRIVVIKGVFHFYQWANERVITLEPVTDVFSSVKSSLDHLAWLRSRLLRNIRVGKQKIPTCIFRMSCLTGCIYNGDIQSWKILN